MRVIAGDYKSKKLIFPKSKNVRPTADMVKKAMFSTLFDKVIDSTFLDLFCGSGQIGIEALSRGAKEVFFVDNSFDSIKTTRENLKNINGKYIVKKQHFTQFLNGQKNKFDIIFIDPPYESNYYNEALFLIYKNNLLKDDGIIICEHKNSNMNFENYKIISTKKYGIKILTYLKKIN